MNGGLEVMDLSKVIIKNLEREDVSGIKAFFDVINSRDHLEISIPEHDIEYILSNDEIRKDIFLAYLEDKIIGFAGCMRNVSQPQNAHFEVVIHPDYRQQGLGCKLYDIILGRAKDFDIKNGVAFAKERMPQSVSFLQNRGFKIDKYMWKMDLELKDADYRIIPVEKWDIRAGTIEDNKDYVDIMNSGFKKEGEELYTEKSFIMMFGKADRYIFFIEQNSKIIATAAISLQKDIDRGYIHNVTVYKDFRGKGFGEIALSHCINIIKEAGLQKAALNVDGTNSNALSLYKKLGFVEKDTDIVFKLEL